jgi:hypothetical protein
MRMLSACGLRLLLRLRLQFSAMQQVPKPLGSAGCRPERVVPCRSLRLEICNVALLRSVCGCLLLVESKMATSKAASNEAAASTSFRMHAGGFLRCWVRLVAQVTSDADVNVCRVSPPWEAGGGAETQESERSNLSS